MHQAREAIDYVRTGTKPCFFLVETYRLNAHSKGDDDRDPADVARYSEKDFLNISSGIDARRTIIKNHRDALNGEIDSSLVSKEILRESDLHIDQYYRRRILRS